MTSEQTLSIIVSVSQQQLHLYNGGKILRSYPVSTAKNGVGQINGSECTPLGSHLVVAKIGKQAPENAVFVGRSYTGEIYSDELRSSQPSRDWILTRILWLSGVENGINRGGDVDTFRRYIYIHGCPDSDSFAAPSSHGCVKMRNADIIDLFERVPAGIKVNIKE